MSDPELESIKRQMRESEQRWKSAGLKAAIGLAVAVFLVWLVASLSR